MDTLWYHLISSVFAAFAAAMNGLVGFVIVRKPRLHTTANWFVLSLAVADDGVGLTSIPFNFKCGSDFHDCSHTLVTKAYWFFLDASVTSLCCMVADRYISVVWSLRYRDLVTPKRALLLIVTAWTTALLASLASLPLDLLSEGHGKTKFQHFFVPLHTFLFLVLPSLFLIVATSHMIHTARKIYQQRMVILAQLNFNRPQGTVADNTAENDAKIYSAIIVSIAVGSVVLCYSSDTYIFICCQFDLCDPPDSVYSLSGLLYIINSLLNPIAYALVKGDIKTELKRLSRQVTTRVSP